MARNFWQSELRKVWTQYLVAGIAMVPGGLFYAGLTNRLGQSKAFWLSVALAAGTGLVAWRWVGHLLCARAAGAGVLAALGNEQSNEAGQAILANRSPRRGPRVVAANIVWSESNTIYSNRSRGIACAQSSLG